jgi:hypothetical protein
MIRHFSYNDRTIAKSKAIQTCNLFKLGIFVELAVKARTRFLARDIVHDPLTREYNRTTIGDSLYEAQVQGATSRNTVLDDTSTKPTKSIPARFPVVSLNSN